MLTSLRLRILIATLVVIAVALILNGAASYLTVKSHNDDQIAQQLDSIARGNALAIEEWIAARASMVEATREPVIGDAPRQALIQLAESGGFLSAYLGKPDGSLVSSDGWVPPDDYDPRQRGWYRAATEQERTIVSLPYVDANTGGLVVTFATPVERNGRLQGVIGGDVLIDKLIEQVGGIRPTPSSFAFLSSGGETLIAHPDPDLTLEPLTRVSEQLTPSVIAELGRSPEAWNRVAVDEADKRLAVTPIAGTDWELGVALDEYEATAGLRGMMSASAITLVVVALGAALILGGLLRIAFRRLLATRDAMENVASGQADLTRRLPEDGNDEVAQIANAFNRFVARMESVMLTIRDSSESVRVAATEITQGGQDLSRRTENAASSLQQTSASMEEITSTVEHTAESSRQANGLAESASDVARRGGEAVTRVVTTMDGITDASRQIGEIVSVMDSIAFQTNLLALNASVEAARAGEQGRGFAVVAGEVRQLASRSAEAAKQIKGLIDTSVERTEEGAAQVREAGDTMQELVESVTRVADVLAEITAATGEQSDGIGQVNVAVSELDRMTQQNAALVEESTTAAEQLKDQADRLAEAVGGFTLSRHAHEALADDSSYQALPGRVAEPA
ncbi:methyl-accepting chemotaxis protein [Halomonas beimenensis]|uniref:Methyl-accepting chemotaxis protein I (Serine chemoreceptor protein) n=1 Tax=Halomonas beimenensis TaxID=475662 RepID=A0A291PCL4_9GAMM|nr:methyl-accepting chemotaxis protein [Halomonas beimenensis]ATJ84653.1 methyl-accepting chemotaxis protein I (serine chemoreceptor protein) [Halomonas beimenensis]